MSQILGFSLGLCVIWVEFFWKFFNIFSINILFSSPGKSKIKKTLKYL